MSKTISFNLFFFFVSISAQSFQSKESSRKNNEIQFESKRSNWIKHWDSILVLFFFSISTQSLESKELSWGKKRDSVGFFLILRNFNFVLSNWRIKFSKTARFNRFFLYFSLFRLNNFNLTNQIKQNNKIQPFFSFFFNFESIPSIYRIKLNETAEFNRFVLFFSISTHTVTSKQSSWSKKRFNRFFSILLEFDSTISISWSKLNKITRFDRFFRNFDLFICF